MMMTKAEIAARKDLLALFYTHYRKDLTQDERQALVNDFMGKHLDKISPSKPFMKHPLNHISSYAKTSSALEILADFLLAPKQANEKLEDYPILSADRALKKDMQKVKVERTLIFQHEIPDNEEGQAPKVSPGCIVEDEAISSPSAESEAMSGIDEKIIFEGVPRKVIEYRKQIRHVKRHANFYAATFEEMGYNYDLALQRIKALDVKRVYECDICRNAAYARDLRKLKGETKVCDQQRGAGGSKFSCCELEHMKRTKRIQRETA
ncbi:hypothetical protein [Rummeliibacillus suwonensis]|uniref:hypothetical protein n=1 Tax=Rummeliibacillus suwonensis TaxID=1306154 RepID=UPI001AAEAE96|nr:hypothetical protein [Rummeliibacillus suwonensis]MBO2536001.1 hypothetical protein [Rummeliibacillus suwonensis]